MFFAKVLRLLKLKRFRHKRHQQEVKFVNVKRFWRLHLNLFKYFYQTFSTLFYFNHLTLSGPGFSRVFGQGAGGGGEGVREEVPAAYNSKLLFMVLKWNLVG